METAVLLRRSLLLLCISLSCQEVAEKTPFYGLLPLYKLRALVPEADNHPNDVYYGTRPGPAPLPSGHEIRYPNYKFNFDIPKDPEEAAYVIASKDAMPETKDCHHHHHHDGDAMSEGVHHHGGAEGKAEDGHGDGLPGAMSETGGVVSMEMMSKRVPPPSSAEVVFMSAVTTPTAPSSYPTTPYYSPTVQSLTSVPPTAAPTLEQAHSMATVVMANAATLPVVPPTREIPHPTMVSATTPQRFPVSPTFAPTGSPARRPVFRVSNQNTARPRGPFPPPRPLFRPPHRPSFAPPRPSPSLRPSHRPPFPPQRFPSPRGPRTPSAAPSLSGQVNLSQRQYPAEQYRHFPGGYVRLSTFSTLSG